VCLPKHEDHHDVGQRQLGVGPARPGGTPGGGIQDPGIGGQLGGLTVAPSKDF